jgi:hypothetical protein
VVLFLQVFLLRYLKRHKAIPQRSISRLLKVVVPVTYEMLIYIYQTTRRNKSEYRNLNTIVRRADFRSLNNIVS